MKHWAILTALLLIQAPDTFSQGSLTYQNTLGVGKEKWVYVWDWNWPLVDDPALWERYHYPKAYGTGYSAELWWAPGPAQPESALRPVEGSVVNFRTGVTSGLINGKSKLDIAGTQAGDIVTLQLRAWKNEGGTLRNWDEASTAATERGTSNVFGHQLGGIGPDGVRIPGTGSLAVGLQPFLLRLIPEPSAGLIAALGLIGLWTRRRSWS